MEALQLFKNEEFGEVRSLIINNEPWFVGKDVARALGYGEGKSLNNAVAKHVDDEDKGVTEMMTPGGRQNVTIINESGLYSLILSSKLPTAKKFKHWVTSEVLPALRKHGHYEIPKSPMEALKLMFDAQSQTNEKVDAINDRVVYLEENKRLEAVEYNYIKTKVGSRVKGTIKDLQLTLNQKQRSHIYHCINRDLNKYIGINTRTQMKEKDFDRACEFIDNWQLSYTDKKIIEDMIEQ